MKTLRYVPVVGALVLASCAQPVRVDVPPPVESPRKDVAAPADVALIGEPGRRPTSLQQSQTPEPPSGGPAISGVTATMGTPPLRGDPINVNIEAVPVPTFINEFFGNVLKVSFQMDPAVAKMSDLITLRTSGPQSPQNFYRLATRVLQTYGVSTSYEGGRLFFTQGAKGTAFEPPLVMSGRALPDVPVSHRPVFQLIELQSVRTSDVNQWLRTAFKTDALEIQDDLNRNAVVLYGRPDIVAQAAAAIRVLDRPYMRGRVSTRLEPAFVSADELGRRLVDVLTAEGYGASLHTGAGVVQSASVIVLPIASANTVVVFAAERAVLDHAIEWAQTIDRPNPTASGNSLFYYQVQNTRAEDIVATLGGVRNAASNAAAAQSVSGQTITAGAPAPTATTAVAPGASGGAAVAGAAQLVLDAPRNAIIFQGTAAEWSRLLPLVKQMDRAARQVMIEVTIAEVTLNNDQEFGVSWLARNADLGRFNGTITSGTLGGTNSGGTGSTSNAFSGLTYLLDVAGQARAQLRAYAEDNRLSILSTPRLMVKSGEEASIDVGTEVPTVTTQTASVQQTNGNSNLLQSIEYRKTGIILNIQPIVYSDNRIDLKVRQEVSEALPLGANDVVKSPSIFNRSVSTNLSLRDGSAILIGGLMSNRQNTGSGGVPFLKDVPVVGNLFKTQTRGRTRTELVLMIVPYIVESDMQAAALTQSIGDRLDLIELPTRPGAPVVPKPLPARPKGQ
ncbi:secretin N-terminal domain-containing protein [Lysobacter xanthus]